MKKVLFLSIALLFFTAFAGDTLHPKKQTKRTLLERIFHIRKVKKEAERIQADTRVSIAIIRMLIDSNSVKIDSLVKEKIDSLNK